MKRWLIALIGFLLLAGSAAAQSPQSSVSTVAGTGNCQSLGAGYVVGGVRHGYPLCVNAGSGSINGLQGTPPVFNFNGNIVLKGPIDDVLMGTGANSLFVMVAACNDMNPPEALTYSHVTHMFSCLPVSGAGALLAVNNLSDVANAATAAANLGVPQLGAAGVFFNDLGSTSVNQVRNPMAAQVLVNGTTNTYLTAGAKCDGTTDDTTALQNTIFACEGITDITQGNPASVVRNCRVEIPATGHCCLHSQPLRVTDSIYIGGDTANSLPGSSLCQDYDGATINVSHYQQHNLSTTTNSALAGNWLALANVQYQPYITLTDYLDTPNFNLNGDTVIDIQGVDERDELAVAGSSANRDYVFETSYNKPGAAAAAIQVWIDYGGTPTLKAQVNNSTSGSVNLTGPAVVTGTAYHWHIQKNGNTCHFWVNSPGTGSTDYGPATCTGTLVQGPFEQSNIPGNSFQNYWPDGGDFNESTQAGDTGANAYIQVSNVARSDGGFPSARPAVDSNTILLCNWTSMNTPDGTQACYNGTKLNGLSDPFYFNIKEGGPGGTNGATQINGVHIANLNLNNFDALISAPSGGYVSDGIYASWGSNDEFDHLFVPNCNAFGVEMQVYESQTHDSYLNRGTNANGCKAALIIPTADDDRSANNITGYGWVGFDAFSAASYSSVDDLFANGTQGYIPWFSQMAFTTLYSPRTDNENGDNTLMAAIEWIEGGTSAYTDAIYSPVNIGTSNNAPFVEQDNDSDPVLLSGGGLSGSTTSTVIHIDGVGPPYFPVGQDTVDNVYLAGNTLTNYPSKVRYNSNAEGAISVADYGADPTDQIDSTAAFNNVIAAACPNGVCIQSIKVPAGKYKVSQINATNLFFFDMFSPSPSGGDGPSSTVNMATLDCEEASNNSGVCMDFSGDQYNTLDGIQFNTVGSKAPKIDVLMAKTTNVNGNSQSFDWRNVSVIQNGGSYGIYDYGGELFHCQHCNINGTNSSPTVAGLMISVYNTPAVTSPFTTLVTAPTSMTVVNFDGISSLSSSGAAPVVFDTGSNDGGINVISFSGFCNHPSGVPCMTDYSSADTGTLRGLTIKDFRDESFGTPSPLINLVHTTARSVHVSNTTYSSLTNLSGGAFTFFSLGDALIQADYETIAPQYGVVCNNGGGAVLIIDAINASGGNVPNNCGGGAVQETITPGGFAYQYDSILEGAYTGTSCSNSALPSGYAQRECTNEATGCTNGSNYASGGSTHCLLYCNGSAWVETGSGC